MNAAKANPSLSYNYEEIYDLTNYRWKRLRIFKVILFISCHMTISILHGVPSSIVNCTLKVLRDRSRFWDHTFPQAEFAKDGIINGSFDRNSRMSSFKDRGTD